MKVKIRKKNCVISMYVFSENTKKYEGYSIGTDLVRQSPSGYLLSYIILALLPNSIKRA
jgi:hypothetical protein